MSLKIRSVLGQPHWYVKSVKTRLEASLNSVTKIVFDPLPHIEMILGVIHREGETERGTGCIVATTVEGIDYCLIEIPEGNIAFQIKE